MGILGDDVEFGSDEAEARFADDEENFRDARVGFEMLENGAGVESAAGAGDSDGDSEALSSALGHREFSTLGRRFKQSQGAQYAARL